MRNFRSKNVDPSLHPFERAREYVRALNAVKLEKMFAKPFVSSLAHNDGIWCLETIPSSLIHVISGTCDGELRIWDLSSRKCLLSTKAHTGFTRGVTVSRDSERILTCSDDQTIKIWRPRIESSSIYDAETKSDNNNQNNKNICVNTILGTSAFNGITHQCEHNTIFATASVTIDLWDQKRQEPLHTFNWGADSFFCTRFNPIDTHILAVSASDRRIVLYDTRTPSPLKQLVLSHNSNDISWNPTEAFNFTLASEDSHLYTFDMRKLDSALCVHSDHIGAVLSVSYSPTGREFVSGGYDKTLRIFNHQCGHSREIYHSKRIYRLFCVKYSADNKYVLSGSSDHNVRLWRSHASEKSGPITPREKKHLRYCTALKKRFSHNPQIRSIMNHRHLPSHVRNATRQRKEHKESIKRKMYNKVRHTKPGTVEYKAERKRPIINVVE